MESTDETIDALDEEELRSCGPEADSEVQNNPEETDEPIHAPAASNSDMHSPGQEPEDAAKDEKDDSGSLHYSDDDNEEAEEPVTPFAEGSAPGSPQPCNALAADEQETHTETEPGNYLPGAMDTTSVHSQENNVQAATAEPVQVAADGLQLTQTDANSALEPCCDTSETAASKDLDLQQAADDSDLSNGEVTSAPEARLEDDAFALDSNVDVPHVSTTVSETHVDHSASNCAADDIGQNLVEAVSTDVAAPRPPILEANEVSLPVEMAIATRSPVEVQEPHTELDVAAEIKAHMESTPPMPIQSSLVQVGVVKAADQQTFLVGACGVKVRKQVTSPTTALQGKLTFTAPPYVPKAKPHTRPDYTHSTDRLMEIGYENQVLVKKLTDISKHMSDGSAPAGAPPKPFRRAEGHSLPCHTASAAINRRKAASSVAEENQAIYKRLVAIKPSKEMSRDTLEKSHRQNQTYSKNCSHFK